MKRCNNCGWFNLDSAVQCEKCGDESFKPVIEEEIQVVEEQPAAVVEVEQKEEEVVPEVVVSEEVVPEEVVVEEAAPEVAAPHNAMASTVMLGAGGITRPDKDSHCPKCRYPIVGNVDYCPNCGATVRNETEAAVPGPAEVKPLEKLHEAVGRSFDPKATVRDIPEELMTDEKVKEVKVADEKLEKVEVEKAEVEKVEEVKVEKEEVKEEKYKLVSIDTIGALPVVLELDKIVLIEGRRYRFTK